MNRKRPEPLHQSSLKRKRPSIDGVEQPQLPIESPASAKSFQAAIAEDNEAREVYATDELDCPPTAKRARFGKLSNPAYHRIPGWSPGFSWGHHGMRLPLADTEDEDLACDLLEDRMQNIANLSELFTQGYSNTFIIQTLSSLPELLVEIEKEEVVTHGSNELLRRVALLPADGRGVSDKNPLETLTTFTPPMALLKVWSAGDDVPSQQQDPTKLIDPDNAVARSNNSSRVGSIWSRVQGTVEGLFPVWLEYTHSTEDRWQIAPSMPNDDIVPFEEEDQEILGIPDPRTFNFASPALSTRIRGPAGSDSKDFARDSYAHSRKNLSGGVAFAEDMLDTPMFDEAEEAQGLGEDGAQSDKMGTDVEVESGPHPVLTMAFRPKGRGSVHEERSLSLD